MPDNLTQYRAAVADLESKIATATLAAQTHRCLIERAESGEPVPDEELAETAQIARQTAQDVATAEDVARGHRERRARAQARHGQTKAPEGGFCNRGFGLARKDFVDAAGTRQGERFGPVQPTAHGARRNVMPKTKAPKPTVVTSPTGKTVRVAKTSPGQRIPTTPPRPSPIGDPDSAGATWVPIDKYGWPRPKRWS